MENDIVRANFSIHVTMDNVDETITFIRAFGLNVEHVKDHLQHNIHQGDELYLILSISSFSKEFTCTEMTSEAFHGYWEVREPTATNTPWLQIIDRKL